MKIKQKEESIIGYLVASGILEIMLILILNSVLFLVTLFYSEKALPFMLVFFGISILGRFLLKKR